MYAALNIARVNKPARLAQFAANFRAFDAPMLMLIHTPRFMGPPQWSDIGMWLQTVANSDGSGPGIPTRSGPPFRR